MPFAISKEIITTRRETIHQRPGLKARASVPDPGWHDKAITGPYLSFLIAKREAEPAAFHICRLYMRVVMQRADGTCRAEPKGDNHESRMVRQNLPGHAFSGCNHGKIRHPVKLLANS